MEKQCALLYGELDLLRPPIDSVSSLHPKVGYTRLPPGSPLLRYFPDSQLTILSSLEEGGEWRPFEVFSRQDEELYERLSLRLNDEGQAIAIPPTEGLSQFIQTHRLPDGTILAEPRAAVTIRPGAGSDLLLLSPPGVYGGMFGLKGNRYANPLLAVALRSDLKGRGLVIGAGNGHLAIALAQAEPTAQIVASDIVPLANEVAQVNARVNGVKGRIEFVQSDLFDSIDGDFDWIVFNAPRPFQSRRGFWSHPLNVTPHILEKVRDRPDMFDMEGNLFDRLTEALPRRLRKGGRLLLMTEREIGTRLPPNLEATSRTGGEAWDDKGRPDSQFAIQEIRVRAPE